MAYCLNMKHMMCFKVCVDLNFKHNLTVVQTYIEKKNAMHWENLKTGIGTLLLHYVGNYKLEPFVL